MLLSTPGEMRLPENKGTTSTQSPLHPKLTFDWTCLVRVVSVVSVLSVGASVIFSSDVSVSV